MKWLQDLGEGTTPNIRIQRGQARGYPSPHSPTHYREPSPMPGASTREVALCRNGAYNVYWSDDWGEVSCKECLTRKWHTQRKPDDQ